MQQAVDQFGENLNRARNLVGLSESIATLTTEAVDTSDLLRSAIVHAVSALDHFVHEFVRLGMIEIHRARKPASSAHLAFRVTLQHVREARRSDESCEWLENAIRHAHGCLSFQNPDRIADAVRLVSPVKLWEEVAALRSEEATSTKARLGAIVDRRNKIAHEADMDPTNPGERWPIDATLTTDAIDFVGHVGRAIHQVAWEG